MQQISVWIYNIFLILYNAAISVAALFNPKAELWINGRKNIFERLKTAVDSSGPVIWMHCASLGEFEQGRPVLEAIRKEYPSHKILLTFFSPSGYEVRKNYSGADWIFYLPLDTPGNVKKFLGLVKPSLAIFVKYEYWHNYLHQLRKQGIPTILISAIFRRDKIFFKSYGGFHRKMLSFFKHIFVQDAESKNLLSQIITVEKITVAGDTRFDRVKEIADGFQPIIPFEKFTAGKKVIVAGSTWPEDEKNLKILKNKVDNKISLIIAPHEITDSHLKFLTTLFPEAILFSDLLKTDENTADLPGVLIINNIGMLSKLYHYATICYIGGGFNSSGIHNTLEAAVYGKPVIFGPNYQKFQEAFGLIKNKGGFSYNYDNDLIRIVDTLLKSKDFLNAAGNAAGSFVSENTGATGRILNWVRQISF